MNSASVNPPESTTYDAVIIGAGIAGMYQLYRLRKLGLKVIAIETGTDVGGTWYWNRYPGARVDSQAYIYHYWFDKELDAEWKWTERFPAQPETEAYLKFIADRCDLRKDIAFSTTVTSAKFDEKRNRWDVELNNGQTLDAQFFVSCAGMLSAPLTERFEGQKSFKGEIYHTARWPKTPVDFKGKRVGVVGTGATGIQVIQTIAPETANLKVFLRTPQYITPMQNPKWSDEDRAMYNSQFEELQKRVRSTFGGFDYDFEDKPYAETAAEERRERYEMLWADGSLSLWLTSYVEMFFDEAANDEISEFVREKMRARLKHDPKLCELLIPTSYGFGTHRVPLESQFLEAFLLPHVDIVDVKKSAIARIVPEGVQLEDGSVHEVDILVLATGFDAGTGALTRMNIVGRGGRSLTEDWNKEIRTTMGMQIHGYPNLFASATPLSPSAALCNMTTCLQEQVNWITDAIEYLRKNNIAVMEPTAETEEAWVQHHEETSNATLFTKTDSWYVGSNIEGKPRRMLSYCGGVGTFHQKLDEVRDQGYPGFEKTPA